MDTYDYRNRSGDFDTVSMKLDTFNAHQQQKAAEAIKAIEVESITENRQCWIN